MVFTMASKKFMLERKADMYLKSMIIKGLKMTKVFFLLSTVQIEHISVIPLYSATLASLLQSNRGMFLWLRGGGLM